MEYIYSDEMLQARKMIVDGLTPLFKRQSQA